MRSSLPVVDLGAVRVELSSSDAGVSDRLVELFAAFPTVDDAVAPVHRVSMECGPDPSDPSTLAWSGSVDGTVVTRSYARELVESTLTRRINRLVLDAEVDRLHLHAGAVELDGRVVLIVGPTGAGKSTLTAGLVSRGWNLLSDELVGVVSGGRLVGFPRPLTLRRDSWPLFPELGLGNRCRSLARVDVPVAAVGTAYVGPAVRPSLIVEPDASVVEFSSERRAAASMMSALFAESLDLERAGASGLDALRMLVESAPGHYVAGRELDRSITEIARLAAADDPAPRVVERVHVARPGDLRAFGTVGWRFDDDSAAIHDPSGGALADLDAAGFEAWKWLASEPGRSQVEARSPDFVADLRGAGFLR